MGKANSLKDSMKGGLNGLLSSTTPAPKKTEAAPRKRAEEAPAEEEPKKREAAVHCNFVIDKSIHTRMKYLAIDKNMSLRDIVNQAMNEYLERNER
jgi:predicted HicB family RNase H-like nuclease